MKENIVYGREFNTALFLVILFAAGSRRETIAKKFNARPQWVDQGPSAKRGSLLAKFRIKFIPGVGTHLWITMPAKSTYSIQNLLVWIEMINNHELSRTALLAYYSTYTYTAAPGGFKRPGPVRVHPVRPTPEFGYGQYYIFPCSRLR